MIPVKRRRDAKSRLGPSFNDRQRARLARAFAKDTIAAALNAERVGSVVLVGDDLDDLAITGVQVIAEPPAHSSLSALNAAIERGARSVNGPVAVLLGDLPALTGSALDVALTEAAHHERAFVRDADGTGTTLLTAIDPSLLNPAFGTGSALAHAALGYEEIDAGRELTRDVDTVDALAGALDLGVGPHTMLALAGTTERTPHVVDPRL